MTQNVYQWKYNKRQQIIALTDDQLHEELDQLGKQMRVFSEAKVHLTDEMFWLLCSLCSEIQARRKRKQAS